MCGVPSVLYPDILPQYVNMDVLSQNSLPLRMSLGDAVLSCGITESKRWVSPEYTSVPLHFFPESCSFLSGSIDDGASMFRDLILPL